MKTSKGVYDNLFAASYVGEAAKIFNETDRTVLQFLRDYDFEEVIISTVLEKDILEKLNYFKEFPNYLCEIEHYLNKGEKVFLTPSACLQIYPLYKLFYVERKPDIITFQTNVFRAEDNYDFFRKKEFRIREIVFFGEHEKVKQQVEGVWEKICELAKKKLGDDVVLKQAWDSFYPSSYTEIKKKMQIANQVKEELGIYQDGKFVAIASRNYHSKHFSKTFGFDENGKIETACIGVGLDKWTKIICARSNDV